MLTIFSKPPRGGQERGATLVEFALVFPIFMALVLGMFSGGVAYNQDLSINHAAREGSRYAATLAKEPGGLPAANWWGAVKDRIVQAATEDLDLTESGHFVCIALVKADGSTVWTDSSSQPYSQVIGSPPSPAPPANCYSDGLTDTFSRVHVLVGRPGKIETLFFSHDVKMRSKGTARYEEA